MTFRQWYLGIGAAAAALIPLNANAVSVPLLAPPGTEVTIDFQGFTTENAGAVGSGDDGGSCTGGVACKETTWGVGFIKESNDIATSANYFSDLAGTTKIAFVIYGIADKSITANGDGTFNINNTGSDTAPFAGSDGKIHLDMYVYSGSRPCFLNAPASCVQTSDRFGFGKVHGITDIAGGSLYAALEFVPGVDTDPDVTLNQTASGTTSPAHGGGLFYADCVSGQGCDQFQKDAFLSNGFLSTLFGKFSFKETSILDLVPGTAGVQNQRLAGWQQDDSDPITAFGVAIPEPASLALLGSALVAFGVAARRRRQGIPS